MSGCLKDVKIYVLGWHCLEIIPENSIALITAGSSIVSLDVLMHPENLLTVELEHT